MSEPVTKSVPQEQQEQRIETRTAMKRIGGFTIVPTAVAVLDVLGAAALFAQGQGQVQVQVQVQVLADIAWRNCVLRLQGVRGLG